MLGSCMGTILPIHELPVSLTIHNHTLVRELDFEMPAGPTENQLPAIPHRPILGGIYHLTMQQAKKNRQINYKRLQAKAREQELTTTGPC
jgi:hypothetical protein